VLGISESGEMRDVKAAGVAKGALHAWVKSLSILVAKDGVTVKTIAARRTPQIWTLPVHSPSSMAS
jgi:NAD(P)-dependent dehydrogenase (short-subunit alcohol dehydrogenase family)